MIRRLLPGWATLALIALVGCNRSASPSPSATPGVAKPAEKTAAEAKPSAPEIKPLDRAAVTLTDEEVAECKKHQPAEEWPLILDQKLCPSSGEHLGSMGRPIRMVLDGQVVFICCKGCEKDAKANPAAMLRKLGRTAAK